MCFQGKLAQCIDRVVSNKRIPRISFKFSNFAIHNSFPCEVGGKRRINEPLVKITEKAIFL